MTAASRKFAESRLKPELLTDLSKGYSLSRLWLMGRLAECQNCNAGDDSTTKAVENRRCLGRTYRLFGPKKPRLSRFSANSPWSSAGSTPTKS